MISERPNVGNREETVSENGAEQEKISIVFNGSDSRGRYCDQYVSRKSYRYKRYRPVDGWYPQPGIEYETVVAREIPISQQRKRECAGVYEVRPVDQQRNEASSKKELDDARALAERDRVGQMARETEQTIVKQEFTQILAAHESLFRNKTLKEFFGLSEVNIDQILASGVISDDLRSKVELAVACGQEERDKVSGWLQDIKKAIREEQIFQEKEAAKKKYIEVADAYYDQEREKGNRAKVEYQGKTYTVNDRGEYIDDVYGAYQVSWAESADERRPGGHESKIGWHGDWVTIDDSVLLEKAREVFPIFNNDDQKNLEELKRLEEKVRVQGRSMWLDRVALLPERTRSFAANVGDQSIDTLLGLSV